MPKAQIRLQKMIQDSQEFGSDNEHMVSRVFFEIQVEEEKPVCLYVDVKQPVGSSFESGPLEVSSPIGYRGPYNHEALRDLVEQYYRGFVSANGMGINIQGEANIRMQHNTFVQHQVAEIDVNSADGSW